MRALVGAAVLAVAVTLASPSEAHLGLRYPPSRYGEAVLKFGPCGIPDGQRSENVTELESGASIEIVWDEYVDHPGHFRISFDADGDDDFVDPACLSGCDTTTPEMATYSNDTVLLDGIPDSPSGGESSVTVTLPDVECDRCTLQVIQVMYDKPPYTTPGNDIYYQCADLVLRRPVVEPPDSGFELPCVGDCDASGVVTVDELLTGVGVVLEQIPFIRCERLETASVDALVAAIGNALHGCPTTRVREFPDFQRLDFLRGPAFGFCPTYGSVLAATLLRGEDGRYTLKTTVAERGVEGVDRCLIPGRFGGDCTLGRVQGCRTLSEDESALVRDALGSIRVWPEAAPDCGVIDPCLHVSLDWDDVRLSDDPCSSDRPLVAEIERIAGILDSLASDSMGECPAGFCQLGDVFLCNDGNDVGGDGCAVNCSDEVAVPCQIGGQSRLTLQMRFGAFDFPVDGEQTIRVGARGIDSVIPVAVRSAEFHPQPMPLVGLGCLCLHGDALPPLGAGLAGAGFVDCLPSASPVDVLTKFDRDTTPGSIGNAGGLPDDPECDDVAMPLEGVVSRACREGIDPDCGTQITGRCRSPHTPTFSLNGVGSGSALVAYNLRLGFLREAGLCSTEGPAGDGSCRSADYGPDCLPCTSDDAGASAATLVFATTGMAEAAFFDAGASPTIGDIESQRDCGATPCRTTLQGERFDCALLGSDPNLGWTTGTLVAAWSDLDRPELGDSVATLQMRCE